MKRHPPTEPPPDNGRYLVSDGETVFIASCRTFNLDGRPSAPNWIREGEHSGSRAMVWWSRLPRAN